MSKTVAVFVGAVLLVVLMLFSMTYTVSFHEVAIKTRFGKLTDDSIVREPGLKFRLPLFADQVKLYDTRLQLRETPGEQVQTSDEQLVVVKAFMLWRINTQGDGPLEFHRSYPDVRQANDSMIDQFRTALRSGISRFTFDQLAGSKSSLQQAEQAILEEMRALVAAKGVDPEVVGISQMVLSPKTTLAVLARMEASRRNLSDAVRLSGSSLAESIQQQARKQADKIKAFTDQRAAEIRSTGDKAAAELLGEMAMEQELAMLLQSLETLEKSLSENTTLLLPATFDPFHFVNIQAPVNAAGFPQVPPAKSGTPPETATVDSREGR